MKVYHHICASLIAQLVKNPPAMLETLVWFLGQKIPWRRDGLPTPVFLGVPCSSAGKESACNAGDLGLIHGLGRYPGEGNGNPLQYSCLENPMDKGTWWATVHGVTKSWTWLSEFHSLTIIIIKPHFYSNKFQLYILGNLGSVKYSFQRHGVCNWRGVVTAYVYLNAKLHRASLCPILTYSQRQEGIRANRSCRVHAES